MIWRIDIYLDVVFMIIARNCGSHMWWASLAVLLFGNWGIQVFLNGFFAHYNCDGELFDKMGFIIFDFKYRFFLVSVNT